MYASVLLPAVTNREDLPCTLSLFDDDTGEAIDLSGRTLARPGDFTGNNWTVTSGLVVSNSASQITIKDYPIANEMLAIALTTGVNLAILAGAPVTIADPTGLNTMTGYVTSYAPATGAMICQICCAFDFEMRSHHHGDGYGNGYGSSSMIGSDGCDSSPIIQAQLGTGVTMIGVGVLQVRVPAFTMAKLHHKTYGVAMVMYDGADTRQLFIGRQPILSGGVSTMPINPTSPASPYGLP